MRSLLVALTPRYACAHGTMGNKTKGNPFNARQTLGVTSEQFYKEHKRKLHLNVNVTSTNE